MSEVDQQQVYVFPQVRRIDARAPLRWLRAGWTDLLHAPVASGFYGLVLALMGLALVRFSDKAAYALALVTGFLLVGPFLAMGLYDLSRRLERCERPRLAPTLSAWKANLPAIGLYAIILTLLMAVWIRVSVVVVALFFEGGMPSAAGLAHDVLSADEGVIFLVAYVAAGAGFALLVFATSAVSLPMLLDRSHMDTITAMIVSFNAVRTNFLPMLTWGVSIVLIVAGGFLTYYVGLIVAIPLIGHATWHAYRDLVVAEADATTGPRAESKLGAQC